MGVLHKPAIFLLIMISIESGTRLGGVIRAGLLMLSLT